jgi:cytochrome c553
MKLRQAMATLACCLSALCWAQSVPTEPPPVVKARCATCHGMRGETVSEDFPRLAAQHEAYLAKELRDFQTGARDSIMNRFAKGLSEADITALARYFALQPAPAPSGSATELAAVGKYLYEKGNVYAGVPACKACHGERAHGTESLPRLAGQHASYLEREIKEFTQRKRTNDNAVMHTVAEKLTALEVRAVAEYLATLP